MISKRYFFFLILILFSYPSPHTLNSCTHIPNPAKCTLFICIFFIFFDSTLYYACISFSLLSIAYWLIRCFNFSTICSACSILKKSESQRLHRVVTTLLSSKDTVNRTAFQGNLVQTFDWNNVSMYKQKAFTHINFFFCETITVSLITDKW